MDIGLLSYGAALGLSALGSGFGIGVAGMATIGAWKKCYVQNKAAPFLLVVFIAAPLTQTIYGMILMNALIGAGQMGDLAKLGIGLFGGTSIGFSAFWQGKIGCSASDSMAETGKGFGQYMIAIGLIESIAVFTLVFSLAIIK